MDELAQHLDNVFVNNSKGKKTVKRKLMPPPVIPGSKRGVDRLSKQSLSSFDEGFESSLDPLNDTIAETVKRRKRNTNTKQFDSQYFFDSVVNRLETKYQKNRTTDADIDVNKLQIIGKKSLTERTVRKEFGDFESSLEDLRQKSFREKSLASCSTSAPITTAKPQTTKKSTQKVAENRNQTRNSNSRALQPKNLQKFSFQPKKSLKTNISLSSDDESEDNLIVRRNQDLDSDSDSEQESVDSNGSEEFDENHPLMKYENKNLWIDKEYQLMCLKKAIEELKNDNNGRFRTALKDMAKKVFGVPGLPSGPHVVPIVCFNRAGEISFEYYFISEKSPINAVERLRIDSEVIGLSRVIYDWICLPIKPRNCPKRVVYTKKQIQYN